MGRKKGQRRRRLETVNATDASRPRFPNWALPFLVGAVLASVAFLAISKSAKPPTPKPPASIISNDLPSFGELAMMPPAELAKQDIALLNLRCADGLTDVDIDKCLATLDRWAEAVKRDTDRHLYKFQQNPAEYENSEGYFRMMMLITVLQQDFNVHYNPDRIRSVDFKNPDDLFIHGMLASNNGGTCVSMPVLYTAVARRLDYPVYLVTAKAHVFCRWDGSGDRFNIEATNQGMNSFDDDYYMEWPKPIAEREVKAGHYLKSLNASETFAVFLAARGHCLHDTGFRVKARVAYAMAAEKAPKQPTYQGYLAQAMGVPRGGFVEPPMVYRDSDSGIPASGHPVPTAGISHQMDNPQHGFQPWKGQ